MASDESFVAFVLDQLEGVAGVSSRKMFGEYAIYLDGKVVALVCDNRVFVKPTTSGRDHIGTVVEAPPYPGAKNSFLIEDRLDDASWLQELVRITAADLPQPKPKSKPKSKPRASTRKA